MNLVVGALRGTGLTLAVTFVMAAGCTDATSKQVNGTSQNITGPSVTTEQPSYTTGQPITVDYAGMPGNAFDWVAVAAADASDDSVIAWTYINGNVSGSAGFSGLPAGDYEARGYVNDSFARIATSTFTVTTVVPPPNPTVSTDQLTYAPNSTVTLTYTNMPGNTYDWVAVATANAPDDEVIDWVYINGAASGSHEFAGLPGGNYEARAYLNDSFTRIATSSFAISFAPSVTTEQLTYTAGQSITLNFAHMPGNTYDWVGIAVANDPDDSVVEWKYISGAISGSEILAGLPVGDYEARAYLNDSFTRLATSTFTVTSATLPPSPSVTTNQPSYTAGQAITVGYMNMPGNTYDWVGISVPGDPDSSVVEWTYINGSSTGLQVLSGLPVGTYEARAYVNDSFTRVATSASFTVTSATPPPPTVATTQPSYGVGQTITVNYTNLPGNTYDWVAIAVANDPDTSVLAWNYVNGNVTGSQDFSGLPSGSYEARAYLNDSFTRLATSTFTIP